MRLIPEYTGDEAGFEWHGAPAIPDFQFQIRTPGLPLGAEPVIDEELNCIIGYERTLGGVTHLYDLQGDLVSISELPLESPLLDPLDIALAGYGLLRLGGSALFKSGASVGIRRAVGNLAISGLRTRFAALTRQPLKFAAAPLAHMSEPGRYVPHHILKLAIRYGKRVADPLGHAGVFQYTIKMTKNGKPYLLEVVVRERDFTILHFLYKS
ncbi:MAG: hypothetical protein ACN6O8_14280 [Achromobacter sp.]|uniref:hypothetical protein n=1 Tax=Achromobacter sp. TaxID=134375 RepID=UPI003CFFB1F9